MPFSYALFTGTGSLQTFAVPFNYISRDHVSVLVDGSSRSFTWDNAATVRVAPAPANGAVVRVQRNTPKTSKAVDFSDASTLTETALDLGFDQALYNTQEALDTASDLVAAAAAAATLVSRSVPVVAPSDNGRILRAGAPGIYAWDPATDFATDAELAAAVAPLAPLAAPLLTGNARSAAAPTTADSIVNRTYADSRPAAKVSAIIGSWGSSNVDPGATDQFFFEIILPAGTRAVSGVASMRAQGGGGYASGVYSVFLANAALVNQGGALNAQAMTVRAATVEIVNGALPFAWNGAATPANWRLRFFVRNADFPTSSHLVQNFSATGLVVTD